jgi:hypothetical protein
MVIIMELVLMTLGIRIVVSNVKEVMNTGQVELYRFPKEVGCRGWGCKTDVIVEG